MIFIELEGWPAPKTRRAQEGMKLKEENLAYLKVFLNQGWYLELVGQQKDSIFKLKFRKVNTKTSGNGNFFRNWKVITVPGR